MKDISWLAQWHSPNYLLWEGLNTPHLGSRVFQIGIENPRDIPGCCLGGCRGVRQRGQISSKGSKILGQPEILRANILCSISFFRVFVRSSDLFRKMYSLVFLIQSDLLNRGLYGSLSPTSPDVLAKAGSWTPDNSGSWSPGNTGSWSLDNTVARCSWTQRLVDTVFLATVTLYRIHFDPIAQWYALSFLKWTWT